MSSKRRIYICDSHKPKVHGGGCCSDKGSQSLIKEFATELQSANLHNEVELIPTACLSQCITGISIRVWPDQVYYGKVKQEDIQEIVTEHLIEDKPIERIRIHPQPKYVGW